MLLTNKYFPQPPGGEKWRVYRQVNCHVITLKSCKDYSQLVKTDISCCSSSMLPLMWDVQTSTTGITWEENNSEYRSCLLVHLICANRSLSVNNLHCRCHETDKFNGWPIYSLHCRCNKIGQQINPSINYLHCRSNEIAEYNKMVNQLPSL